MLELRSRGREARLLCQLAGCRGTETRASPSSWLGTLPRSSVSTSEEWENNGPHSSDGACDSYVWHRCVCDKGMLSPGHPCVREASTLPARPRDSLVSVGSFPELVSSDPPGEVEKPHGILEVEVRDCSILDERKQGEEMEPARAGRPLASSNADSFF